MGIGGVDHPYSLAEAREQARAIQKAAKLGIDPRVERAQQRGEAAKVDETTFRSFRFCAEGYIASHRSAWKSAQHAQDWERSLTNHAYPLLGDRPVQDITALDVLEVLQPIWLKIPETASRVRNRIELAIDWGIAMGHRTNEANPARWAGKLRMLLPSPTKAAAMERLTSGRREHFDALPWQELPAFVARLREYESLTARALEFTILTVARTNMTRAAEWNEVDFDARVWTVPAVRMKMGKAHEVPLSDRAVEILIQQKEYADRTRSKFIFPGVDPQRPIHDNTMYTFLKRYMGRDDITVHGFRSTFRQWVADKELPPDAAEMALAHTLGKVLGAYQRSKLLDRRRHLMDAWARFISGEDTTVIAFPVRA
jgi:Integrase